MAFIMVALQSVLKLLDGSKETKTVQVVAAFANKIDGEKVNKKKKKKRNCEQVKYNSQTNW